MPENSWSEEEQKSRLDTPLATSFRRIQKKD